MDVPYICYVPSWILHLVGRAVQREKTEHAVPKFMNRYEVLRRRAMVGGWSNEFLRLYREQQLNYSFKKAMRRRTAEVKLSDEQSQLYPPVGK